MRILYSHFPHPFYVTDHRHLNATKSVNANARITSDLKMPNAVIKVKILGQSLGKDRGVVMVKYCVSGYSHHKESQTLGFCVFV